MLFQITFPAESILVMKEFVGWKLPGLTGAVEGYLIPATIKPLSLVFVAVLTDEFTKTVFQIGWSDKSVLFKKP